MTGTEIEIVNKQTRMPKTVYSNMNATCHSLEDTHSHHPTPSPTHTKKFINHSNDPQCLRLSWSET